MTDSSTERKQSRAFSNLLPAVLSVKNPISLYNPQKNRRAVGALRFFVLAGGRVA